MIYMYWFIFKQKTNEHLILFCKDFISRSKCRISFYFGISMGSFIKRSIFCCFCLVIFVGFPLINSQINLGRYVCDIFNETSCKGVKEMITVFNGCCFCLCVENLGAPYCGNQYCPEAHSLLEAEYCELIRIYANNVLIIARQKRKKEELLWKL